MLEKTLAFAVFRSKSHIRVQINRYIKTVNEKGKTKYISTSVGSLRLNEKLQEDLTALNEQLTAIERVEISEYLYSAEFAKTYFDEAVDNFRRDILRLPEGFFEASYQLATLAQANGIAFNPHQVMIEALLTQLKKLELQLSEKLGYPVSILEQYQMKKNE